MGKEIGLHYGALAEPISEQLAKQYFKFDNEQVKHFQKDVEALTRCRIRDLINTSTYDKSLAKLHNKICSHVSKLNKAL